MQINAYITPPQNQGFAPHYDVHDVFVLQVAGRKHWTIHEPVVEAPLDNQPWEAVRDDVAARAEGKPVIDTVLEPGDAIYLPRGTIHAAQALGETSIHLTVGVHPLTRHHLVRELLQAAQDEPELRRSLPMGVDLSDPAVLTEHLAATLDALHRRLDAVPAARLADALGTDLMRRTRPVAIGPLAQLATAETLDAGTRLQLRARAAPAARRRRRARCASSCSTARSSCPTARPTRSRWRSAGPAFAVGELPGLEPDEQVVLARRLVREGVLVPA